MKFVLYKIDAMIKNGKEKMILCLIIKSIGNGKNMNIRWTNDCIILDDVLK